MALEDMLREIGFSKETGRAVRADLPTPKSSEEFYNHIWINRKTETPTSKPDLPTGNVVRDYFLTILTNRDHFLNIYYAPVSDVVYTSRDYFLSEEKFKEVHDLLMEVVKNAFRHGNSYDATKRVQLNVYYGKEGVVFEVVDQGDGIPATIVEKLMKREDPYPDRGLGQNGTFNLLRCLNASYIHSFGFNETRNAVYLCVMREVKPI
jgi:anti-sigma regulatory factor (Ser/Thr protein kinase)